MKSLWTEQALLSDGWTDSVRVGISDTGLIASVEAGVPPAPTDRRLGALLPAPVNLHSHAFQRAMAGMTERRGPAARDTFWTWRHLMFRFLEALTPEDVEAIAAFVQMEMLESGYASVAEFHYVHHQPDGTPYADIGELSGRIAAAAQATGIGLTLLPVLYQYAGCNRAPLARGQVRFGNTPERFAKLHERAGTIMSALPSDASLGVAPHSLRAVGPEGLDATIAMAAGRPHHMHLAEQVGEVDEVRAVYGRRPVEWLLDNHGVDESWCLIHCTQMTQDETLRLAQTGAVAGLCPITESSLGDGIFNGTDYLGAGGRFGVGSDSNIRIALSEELRTLEYSQRLRDGLRAVLATERESTGRVLFAGTVRGGAQAVQRQSGAIASGNWADLLALDTTATDLANHRGDALLDSFVFAGDDRMVADVWSAGRHLVHKGHHIDRDRIVGRYRKTMSSLKDRL
ncbi:formimidoylglutamate deiminase [Pelagibacterium nitratireducens]|uniref:Formimidoylglutamate deiminase n=1 Tax=Pelagibacterium nitratireducens TaxID=1046114 RepID=A0ABZ2I0K7_9HYPH